MKTLIPGALALLLSACASVPEAALQSASTQTQPTRVEVRTVPAGAVVFALRHAEAEQEGRDPSLTKLGQSRAAALAQLLGSTGVTHLSSSGYARTDQTLAPLAERAQAEVVTLAPSDPAALLDWIGELSSGDVACIAGHSNTIPALLQSLGADVSSIPVHEPSGERRFDHDRHDRLFCVVGLGDEKVRSFELALSVASEHAPKRKADSKHAW